MISVGNISLGGTGKTPAVIHLSQKFQAKGISPAVVCRGYGCENPNPLLVSSKEEIISEPDECGDEAYLLAQKLKGIPVVVCTSKREAALWTEKNLDVDLLIVDDGFQHRSLERDYDLVLVDSTRPPQEENIFPRGLLREPARRLKDADGIILSRAHQVSEKNFLSILDFVKPLISSDSDIYMSWIKPDYLEDDKGRSYPPEELKGDDVLAFSGLGNPESFERTLHEIGCNIVEHAAFPDHYDYSYDDFLVKINESISRVEHLRRQGKEIEGAVTTEKDAVKIDDGIRRFFAERDLKLFVLKIDLGISPVEDKSCSINCVADDILAHLDNKD